MKMKGFYTLDNAQGRLAPECAMQRPLRLVSEWPPGQFDGCPGGTQTLLLKRYTTTHQTESR